MKLEKQELRFLLGLANDFRAKKQVPKLDDLPDSIPGDTGNCIIANAFNFNCDVEPSGAQSVTTPMINFCSIEDTETFIQLVGEKYRYGDYSAILPDELNTIAINFDKGKYDKYIQPGCEKYVRL